MGNNKRLKPVLDPWEVGEACGVNPCSQDADQAVAPEDGEQILRGGFRNPADIGSLGETLKRRNAKARSKVKEPARRSRKKLSQTLARIMAGDSGD